MISEGLYQTTGPDKTKFHKLNELAEMSSEKRISKKRTEKRNHTKESSTQTKAATISTEVNYKYGPLPKFSGQRIWSRGVLVLGILIYMWYFSKNGNADINLAIQSELYSKRGQNLECSTDYMKDVEQYSGCIPVKCGRYVSDKIVTQQEADILLKLAERVMSLGGSSGGATILDLHSGALSYKDQFINVKAQKEKQFIKPAERTIYQLVRAKIQAAIAESFGLNFNSLHLTHPTFFSRLTNADAKTIHDEYWHPHVDKETYESFHYTSLLYLNDYGKDFKGGKFYFLEDMLKSTKNTTVEPRAGRVLMFTSGSENPHAVERVTEGTRFAITVSFTCDAKLAIDDNLQSS